MPKVNFDRNSFNKCLCGGCPVQRNSACVIDKEKGLEALKEEIEYESTMPDPPGAVPGIYCSTVGKSECGDLKPEKSCLCPACPVSLQAGLENNYYCTKGSADQVG